jgi:hypothetical protein
MKLNFGLLNVTVDKFLEDTSNNSARPFYAKVKVIIRVRVLGVLIYRIETRSNFPDSSDKI